MHNAWIYISYHKKFQDFWIHIFGVKIHQKPRFVKFPLFDYTSFNTTVGDLSQDQRISIQLNIVFLECTCHDLQSDILLAMFQIILFFRTKRTNFCPPRITASWGPIVTGSE